jgi:hypothetical protein
MRRRVKENPQTIKSDRANIASEQKRHHILTPTLNAFTCMTIEQPKIKATTLEA